MGPRPDSVCVYLRPCVVRRSEYKNVRCCIQAQLVGAIKLAVVARQVLTTPEQTICLPGRGVLRSGPH
jgi:hypothetical protein